MLKEIFREKSFIIEYPYSVFPTDYSCDSLYASLTYLDENNTELTLYEFTNKDFKKDSSLNWCILKFDVEQILDNNLIYQNIKL